MRREVLKYLLLSTLLAVITACSVTKHVPHGSYLLKKNNIKTDKEAPAEERLKASEIEKNIRQSPNKRVLGAPVFLWLYNMTGTDSVSWLGRQFRKIGEPPVIFDSTIVRRSVANIRNNMVMHGFVDSESYFSIDTSGKKAIVSYSVRQNRPYRISEISFDFRDKFIEPIVLEDTLNTFLKVGGVLDLYELKKEQIRVATTLRNKGYYDFSINNIRFDVLTTDSIRTADVVMVLDQYQSGTNDRGEAIMENNSVYRIKEVIVHPDFNPLESIKNQYGAIYDTVQNNGLDIIYKRSQNVRPSVLRRTIPIYPNYLFSPEDERKAYENMMKMGYFRSANIIYSPVPADTAVRNEITYIGSDEGVTSELTTEKYLRCNIFCVPAKRQSALIDTEVSTTSSFYSFMMTLGYQNKNFFKGTELFDVNIKGGREWLREAKGEKSYEFGVSTSITFPRFEAPFNIDRHMRLSNPRTRVELSFNRQNRPYYHRTLSSAVVGYSWKGKKHSSFIIKPIDISMVKMSNIDSVFQITLDSNLYLKKSYESQFITGISGSYIYNNQDVGSYKSSFAVRVNWETSGNIASGFSRMFGKKTQEGYYNLFGERYAQYFRADASFSKRWVLGDKTSIAYRLYGGCGVSYGNSQAIPFDRLFFAGGSNSMRGWQARTLGPGSTPKKESDIYPSQLANMKLETNLEGRFPVWSFINGALFFDAGNIWFIKKTDDTDPNAIFKINSFHKQLGLNTGVGARLDFKYFVLRLDWGIKLHDPNMPENQRWIKKLRFSDTVMSFGVNYPF